jgi:hypothetical protein
MAERAERKEGRKRGGDMADPPQETVSEDKGGYRWCVNDGLNRQAEVGGDLLVEPERIPAIEDDLLDDRLITVCDALAHGGNVPTDTRRKRP